MANVNLLRGGNPQSAPSLVSADQTTIIGDGTAQNPLRAGGSTAGLERVTLTGTTATLDPDIQTSIVYRGAAAPNYTVTLPDPSADTPDGFIKYVLFMFSETIGGTPWTLEASFDANIPSMAFGNAQSGIILIWNKQNAFWMPAGSNGL